jgi:hypothetical protein
MPSVDEGSKGNDPKPQKPNVPKTPIVTNIVRPMTKGAKKSGEKRDSDGGGADGGHKG